MKKILNIIIVSLTVMSLTACQKNGVNTALAQTTAETVMGPGVETRQAETAAGPGVETNPAETGAATMETFEQGEFSKPAPETEGKMKIHVVAGKKTIEFELNDSAAAMGLYEQLPLTLEVDNFSSNEKVFYPPEKLDVTDTPQAASGVGTLAYYAPWGDVVMFYGSYTSNGQLFELGQAVSGAEEISGLSGTLEIKKAE